MSGIPSSQVYTGLDCHTPGVQVSACLAVCVHIYLHGTQKRFSYTLGDSQPGLPLDVCNSTPRHRYKSASGASVQMEMLVQKSVPPNSFHSTGSDEVNTKESKTKSRLLSAPPLPQRSLTLVNNQASL